MKIGVDFGGSHIALAVINDQNVIIKKYERDFSEEDKKNIISVIENFIIQCIEDNEEQCEKIGIAVPGATKDGVIIKTVNLGIENYNIREELQKKLKNDNIEIILKNDVKSAAIAEYNQMIKNGELQKDDNMLFLGIGTGIGGAFIQKGEIFRGNSYEGTEFGHMIIKENGIACRCGKNGCFERYGSILEFKNKVKQRLNISQDINGEKLREIMNEKCDDFIDLKDEYVENLAVGISNLINIFEPDVIVLGGGFTHFHYMFVNDLKNKLLNSTLLFNKRNSIDIRIAKLGNDAGMLGSIF